jgi:UDP-N-acetylmuramate dehydrogenase
MTSLADLPGVSRDLRLADHTWYELGGPAAFFAQPADEAALAAVVETCEREQIPLYPLGLGANLLASDDGVDGCVVHLRGDAWQACQAQGEVVTVAAGVRLAWLVKWCARRGLSGMEPLVGVPGTVGGAVRMNAGGRHGDFGSRVTSVRVMNRRGEVRERDDVRFDYRRSDATTPDEPMILGVTLRLDRAEPADVQAKTKQIMAERAASQPYDAKSAGCAFKNPPGDSAGRLIDACGLKGTTHGGAAVSDRHANFIVARPGCRAADVAGLIELVRGRVTDATGVRLESEIVRWPLAA